MPSHIEVTTTGITTDYITFMRMAIIIPWMVLWKEMLKLFES